MNFPSFYIALLVLLEIYMNVPWFTAVLCDVEFFFSLIVSCQCCVNSF